ncbi:histidine kinase dimerization/phosphoacceptor domain -containing protein [Hansschlegelia beijingensis]
MDTTEPAASIAPLDRQSPAVASLIHQFRNQLQTMTSLVSLAAQRAPGEESRAALEDLRARMEALTIIQPEESASDGLLAADRVLTLLGHRICQLYDPDGRRRVGIKICPLQAPPRQTGVLAQIVTELLIKIYRSGADEAEIVLAEDGEFLAIGLTKRENAGESDAAPGSLGELLLEGLARSLGGAAVRCGDGGVRRVSVPREAIGVDFTR